MAVAIFNECFGEICALKNEQPEQNVGMCQKNVGEMSEKHTDENLISKQVVIDIVEFECGEWKGLAKTIIKAIKDVPSAEKTTINPKKTTITDGDLISRDYILSKFKEHCDRCGKYKGYNGVMCRCCELDEAIDYVEDAPSAEKNAEWIEVIDEIDSLGNKTWHHECSICGSEDSGWGNYKYCPNCGRRMKGESDGENQI